MERDVLILRKTHCWRPLIIVKWTWLPFQWMIDAHCQNRSPRDSRIIDCTWGPFQVSTHGDILPCPPCLPWQVSVIWHSKPSTLLRTFMTCVMFSSKLSPRTQLLKNWPSMRDSRCTDINSSDHWLSSTLTEISVIDFDCLLIKLLSYLFLNQYYDD